jgi:hypothetical protein
MTTSSSASSSFLSSSYRIKKEQEETTDDDCEKLWDYCRKYCCNNEDKDNKQIAECTKEWLKYFQCAKKQTKEIKDN